jgi:predicted transcriptional regulator
MKPANLSDLKANAALMSQRLKVMSHAERLLMLCRMDEGEVSVNELVAMTGLSQSAVSQHLALLRAEDVVMCASTRKRAGIASKTRSWRASSMPCVICAIVMRCSWAGVRPSPPEGLRLRFW